MHPSERLLKKLNDRPRWVLGGLIVLAAGIALLQSSHKALWFDELVTLYLGQVPFDQLWSALLSGADPNPPLTHMLAHVDSLIFGENAFALRLPSILAMTAAIASVWALVRRRSSPVFAAVGVLILMATRGFDYSYDGRSYALLLGTGTIALAAWDTARQRPTSWMWPTAMCLALFLGLSANYYGALAFLPIAAGELTALLKAKHVSLRIWAGLVVAATPLILFRELIRAASAAYVPHAWNRASAGVIAGGYTEIVEAVALLAFALIGYAIWKRRAVPLSPFAVAVMVAALLPVAAYLVARFGAGIVSARCAIVVCSGMAIAAAMSAARALKESPKVVAGLLALLFVWVIGRETACGLILARQKSSFVAFAHSLPQDRPIAVSDSLMVLPLSWYGTPDFRQNLIFPVDFDAINRFEKNDSGERNLWGGRGVFPVRIQSYRRWRAAGIAPETVLLTAPESWLVHTLEENGYRPRDLSGLQGAENFGGVFTPLAHPETHFFTPGTVK